MMINLILCLLFMGFLFHVGNNFLPDILLIHRNILGKLTPSLEFNGSEELTQVEPSISLFTKKKIEEEINNDFCLPKGTEVEIAKLKLEDIENSIHKLKAQSSEMRDSYSLAFVQLIETLQLLEKSLQNDRLNLATFTTEKRSSLQDIIQNTKTVKKMLCNKETNTNSDYKLEGFQCINKNVPPSEMQMIAKLEGLPNFVQILQVTRNKSQPLHLVLPLGGVAVGIKKLFSSINEGNVNCNEEQCLLYESKGKELKAGRKSCGIKPDNVELANGRSKSLQGKDQVLTESPSWHKCTYNSSIIHPCKKSTLSLQSDGYATICPSFFNECNITKENQNQSLTNEYYQTTIDEKPVVKSINNSHINNESFLSSYNSRMHYTSATGPSKHQRIVTCYDSEQSELSKENRRFEVDDVKNSKVINKKVLNTGLDINTLLLTEHEIFETTNNSETDTSNRKVLQATNKQNLLNFEGLSEDSSLLSIDTKDDESKSNLQFCFFKNDKLLNASHTDKIEIEDYPNGNVLDSMQIVHNVMKTMNSNYKTVTNSNNGGKLIGYIYHKSLKAYVDEEYKIFIEKEKINIDIVEKQLGLDKESSILFILKTLEDNNNRLLQSSLSPRQKISLACSLFSAINDFNICGSTWALICSEVIKDINGNFVRLYIKEKNYRHCLRCLCVIYKLIYYICIHK